MTPKSLAKLKQDLRDMRKNPHGRKAEELISIAQRLGRKRDTSKGKEPTYVRERDPALSPPLSIPSHGGKDLKVGTAKNIIDILLDDVSDWEQFLSEAEDANE